MLGIVFCLCISFTASKGIIQVECKAAAGIQKVALPIASCILRLVERGLQLPRSVVRAAVVVGYDVIAAPRTWYCAGAESITSALESRAAGMFFSFFIAWA